MTDIDKVLTGLECLITNEVPCEGCPYNGSGYCTKNIAKDALELLKEQEPVKVHHLHGTKVTMHEEVVFTDECGYCSGYLLKTWKACPICGRAVKWDE